MNRKKTIAALTAFMLGCTPLQASALFFADGVTAYAENQGTVSFDESTGTLTLSGYIEADDVQQYSENANVKTIVAAEGTVFPEDCYSLFGSMNASSMDLSKADTSNVKNMEWMFYNCGNLTSLDLSSFNTSQVTDMHNMFSECVNLESLDLNGFDTSNVIDMEDMFGDCKKLTSIDLSSFNTKNVEDMHWMFMNCFSLKSLDLSSFNTSSVTNMVAMFGECESLESLDLSSFNTSNVTTMGGMFHECVNLSTLDLSSFDTSKVTNMNGMFLGCYSLETIYVDNFDTSSLENSGGMFSGCVYLIGGNDTIYNDYYTDATYARIDRYDTPGYFTGKKAPVLYGDANCSGEVDIADSVFIMQSLSNPSKYQLSEQSRRNADCVGNGDGITNSDALAIQKYMLKLIDTLPA